LYGGKREKFIDVDNQEITDEERSADAFASEQLIPAERLKTFLENTEISVSTIKEFADEIDIHPGIVVGRLQHDKILQYNNLIGLKEKFIIKEES
jgi:Zn-dependent peptidase ImmA (M78 family)